MSGQRYENSEGCLGHSVRLTLSAVAIRKRKLAIGLALLAVFVVFWCIANPPGRFGWCRYALTTYNCIPRLVSDLQIRSDGSRRTVPKTHDLRFELVQWLLEPKPEVLIISLGWDGVVQPDERIRGHKDCALHLLKNREAIDLFNQLKKSGRRVAIHLHSTC